LATARLKIEAQAERQADQTVELGRLHTALDAAQLGRTAAEQQAAVLAAKLEAASDRATRAEARAEQIEQQANKTIQAHDVVRAAAAQDLRAAQAQAQAAAQEAALAREQAARQAGLLEAYAKGEAKS
jgi:uncharacterized protein involved in exopolysaccharide biosynthesis